MTKENEHYRMECSDRPIGRVWQVVDKGLNLAVFMTLDPAAAENEFERLTKAKAAA